MNYQPLRSIQDSLATVFDPRACEEMPRILVVEDDSGVRNMLCRLLQRWSFAVVAVSTVEEARSRIAAGQPFAVVLCDYHLPDGNGLEVLYWWKWHRGTELPFVLMSGSADFAPASAHDFEFLLKPFDLEDLRSRLNRLSSCPQNNFSHRNSSHRLAAPSAR